MAANFGEGWSEFWKNAGWSALHPVQVGIGGPTVFVNLLVILAVVQVGSPLFRRCVEQHYIHCRWKGSNPRRNIPLSLIMGTGFVVTVYFLATLGYLMVLPMHGDLLTEPRAGARPAIRLRGSRGHGGARQVVFHSGVVLT